MGATRIRVKKSSKSTPKTTQQAENVPDINTAFHQLEIKTSESDANGKSPISQSSSYLAPPALSSKASHSSLQSSDSSSLKVTGHELDRYEPSRIEIQYTPNKGYALFAASHIAKGAVVLAEIPAIRLTAADEAGKLLADEILLGKFNQLPKKSQKNFKKLHDAKKDGFSRLRSIYHSNCYNLDGSRSTFGGSCIGLTASRINHSCIPNVQFSFFETVPEQLFDNAERNNSDIESDTTKYNPSGGAMVFRALKAIARGKEIVSNYESVYATRSQRRLQFQMHYGFQCDCEACTAATEFWADDDDRRQEMIKYRKQIDATEARIVLGKMPGPNSSEVDAYYLKGRKLKHGPSADVNDLTPLSDSCCREMIETLEALERLLVKERLMGIELHSVREEKALWKKRLESCGWSTPTNFQE